MENLIDNKKIISELQNAPTHNNDKSLQYYQKNAVKSTEGQYFSHPYPLKQDDIIFARLVAIEGLNAAGKSFFANRLKDQLISLGYTVIIVKAPIYEIQDDQIDHFGPKIFRYLNQQESSEQYSNQEIDEMFRINRKYIQENIINKYINTTDFILIDRWIMSGAVYSNYRNQIFKIRSNSNEDSLKTYDNCRINNDIDVSSVQKESSEFCLKQQDSLFLDKLINKNQLLFQQIQDDSFINYTDCSHQTKEVIPDYTVFIDTNIDDIMCRIQSRQQFSHLSDEKVSTQQQIYSNKLSFQYIRTIFRCYINQHIHQQKIHIIDNSFDICSTINMILQNKIPNVNSQNIDQQSFYTCNSQLWNFTYDMYYFLYIHHSIYKYLDNLILSYKLMNSKSNNKQNLVLLFLNHCIRLEDSYMFQYYQELFANKSSNHIFKIILISNQFNKHKREFDLQQAQLLQKTNQLQIAYMDNINKFKQGLVKLSLHMNNIHILIQDTYQNREDLHYVLKTFKQSKIQFIPFDEIDKQQTKQYDIQVNLFEDFLCSNRNLYQFSNVYGYFNKRVQVREMYTNPTNKDFLYNSKQNKYNDELNLIPIQQVKTNTNIQYPTQYEIWTQFQNHIYNYAESRDSIGSLFDFTKPSSSFQSAFLSSGVISTTQLLNAIDINNPHCKIKSILKKVQEKQINPETNTIYTMKQLKSSLSKYRDEVLWAEFCYLYWIYNKNDLMTNGVLNIGGLYNRKRKWIKNNKLLHDFEYGQLDSQYDIINAAMNQLRIQGFMSNRLRMIVASFCMQMHLDWRDCLNIFEKYLIDINFTSNLYGWLFSNCLVSGRNHIFNIERQTKKIDKDSLYRNKWLQ